MNIESLGSEMYCITVDKKSLITGKSSQLAELIRELEKKHKRLTGHSLYNSLVLIFNGYDDVPEEIFEIEPIRMFVQNLYAELPELFYILNVESGVFAPTILCLAESAELPEGVHELTEKGIGVEMGISASFDNKLLKHICDNIVQKGIKENEQFFSQSRTRYIEEFLFVPQ